MDSGHDDGGVDAGKPPPVPTSFTLENTGSAPFLSGGTCGGTFLSLSHDGQDLIYDRSCACACDQSQGACGCPAICLNTQELVVPGKSVSQEWDGLFAHFEPQATCYELAGLTRGDVVTAEGCWNLGPDGAPLACESVEFAYGTDREVTIEAEHISAARTEVTIVLENQTGGPIEIVTDECGLQRWFRLALPEQPEVTLGAFCPCACNADFALSPGTCPVCGGCAETVVETVEPGGTQRFEWDGRFFYTYEGGCANQYAMPAGMFLNAELCFTRQGAAERTCQPTAFVLGESEEVRVVLM